MGSFAGIPQNTGSDVAPKYTSKSQITQKGLPQESLAPPEKDGSDPSGGDGENATRTPLSSED